MKNYTLKVTRNNEEIQRVSTHSIRTFLKHLRSIKFLKHDIEVYLRVSYKPNWFNDGVYKTKKDLWFAFEAFNNEI